MHPFDLSGDTVDVGGEHQFSPVVKKVIQCLDNDLLVPNHAPFPQKFPYDQGAPSNLHYSNGTAVQQPSSSFWPSSFGEPIVQELRDPIYCDGGAQKSLKLDQTTKIPENIAAILQSGSAYTFGTFPDIHRAFVAHKHQIHLWNYAQATKPDTVLWEADPRSSILSVCLATPKSNEFENSVVFLLIVATTLSAHIVELSFRNQSIDDKMHLDGHRFNIDLKGARVLCLASTNYGTIFGGTEKGDVFRLEYCTGWFKRRTSYCKKVDGSIMDQLFRWVSLGWNPYASAVVDLVVLPNPKGNDFLFKLTKNGAIEMFEIQNDSLFLKSRIQDVFKRSSTGAFSFFNSSNGANDLFEHPDIALASLSPVGPFESSQYVIRALTNKFHSILFEYRESFGLFVSKVVHGPSRFFQQVHGTILGDIHSAYECAGVHLVGTSEPSRKVNELLCLIDENDSTTVERHVMQGPVLDINEDKMVHWDSSLSAFTRLDAAGYPLEGLHPNAVQHLLSRRKFICLTLNNVLQFSLQYPIDVLLSKISQNASRNEMSTFLCDNYSPSEAGAMSLILACCASTLDAPPAPFDASQSFNLSDTPIYQSKHRSSRDSTRLINLGRDLFWVTALRPQGIAPDRFKRLTRGETMHMGDMFDGVCDAVYKFVARTLRPLWDRNLFDLEILNSTKGFVSASREMPVQVLSTLHSVLSALLEFLEDTDMQTYLQGEAYARFQADQRLRAHYSMSIAQLQPLLEYLQNSLHAISVFLALAKSPNPNRVFQRLLDPHLKETLKSLSFQDFVWQRSSVFGDLSNILIQAIMEDAPEDVQWIAELQKQAPGRIPVEDLEIFKANQLLVKLSMNQIEHRESTVAQMLQFFLRATTKENFMYTHIAEKLIALGMYAEALQLGLKRAEVVNGRLGGNSEELYQQIIRVISPLFIQQNGVERTPVKLVQMAREKCLGIIETSALEGFHYAFYNWVCSNKLTHVFHSLSHSKFLESYFTRSEQPFLLLESYERTHKFEKAALYCLQLGSSDNSNVDIVKRVELLEKGVDYAKRMPQWTALQNSTSNARNVLLSDLQSTLTVGKLQLELLKEIENIPEVFQPLIEAGVSQEEIAELKSTLQTHFIGDTSTILSIANRFQRWEFLLSVFFASRDPIDPETSCKLWDLIICESQNVSEVYNRTVTLGKKYIERPELFPLHHIIQLLLEIPSSPIESLDSPNLVAKVLHSIGIGSIRTANAILEIIDVFPDEPIREFIESFVQLGCNVSRDLSRQISYKPQLKSLLNDLITKMKDIVHRYRFDIPKALSEQIVTEFERVRRKCGIVLDENTIPY